MELAVVPRQGDRVSFRIADVFLPEPEQVLSGLTIGARVEGTILEFSDSGNSPLTYAVVEIVQAQKVLVPVDVLRVLG
jgi:hypothetical protein